LVGSTNKPTSTSQAGSASFSTLGVGNIKVDKSGDLQVPSGPSGTSQLAAFGQAASQLNGLYSGVVLAAGGAGPALIKALGFIFGVT
jgi:hypothetical protein